MEPQLDATSSIEKNKISRTILVTGSEGRIGQIVTSRLSETHATIICLDKVIQKVRDDAYAVDIRDTEDLERTFKKIGRVDSIIHLAGDPRPEDSYGPILSNNVIGTENLLEAAVRHGVKRVVIASSTHTVGGYEGYPSRLPLDRPDRPMTTEDEPKDDGPYGWSKVEIEKLAKKFHDENGLETICIRFGFVTEDNKPAKGFEPHWLSYRDAAQVVQKALDSKVPYGVYFATSGIAPPMFDISSTIHDLGYKPQDSYRILHAG